MTHYIVQKSLCCAGHVIIVYSSKSRSRLLGRFETRRDRAVLKRPVEQVAQERGDDVNACLSSQVGSGYRLTVVRCGRLLG